MESKSFTDRAREIARETLTPHASRNDKEGRFPVEAIAALRASGLLGLTVPAEYGGGGAGPRLFAEVNAIFAEADASVAMIYMMHTCGVQAMVAGARSPELRALLSAVARGEHLSTLAFSEKGSRSHFWASVARAERQATGVALTALKSWVTSAGHADGYVTSTVSPDGKQPTETTLYVVMAGSPGLRVSAPWDGLGLRANASSPMAFEAVPVPTALQISDDGAGMKAMLEVVLPWFNLGQTAVSLGICRAAVTATAQHLKSTRFEHLGDISLGAALPNLRAQLAGMQIDSDGLAARLDDFVRHFESPSEVLMLRVLESKAAASEVAIRVTSDAMRTCGGAAFSRHTSIERLFRDAHAGAVMAPTGDVLRDFIGKALLGLPLF